MKLILGTLLLTTGLSTAWAGREMLSQQRSSYVRQNVNPNRILSEKNFTGEQVLKDMAEKMTATLNEIQELIHF